MEHRGYSNYKYVIDKVEDGEFIRDEGAYYDDEKRHINYFHREEGKVNTASKVVGDREALNVLRLDPNDRDWNKEFQILLEEPINTPHDAEQREQAISNLFNQFVAAATPTAKAIINSIHYPTNEQTLLPIDIGGIAGGDKFRVGNCLFKFATDKHGLYGGDRFSVKAAVHEYKSLLALIQCNIPGLHVPLTAIISYGGYRMTVSSILPIEKDTICYGSNDGGSTVHDSDAKMASIMKSASDILNLKQHKVVERKTKRAAKICGPVDMEGHFAKDGRYYIIDTARLFPPQTPTGAKQSYLYQLLRPEFVTNRSYNPNPLSPDAYSPFAANEEKAENDGEIDRATKLLFETVIPQAANAMVKENDLENFDIGAYIHRWGINFRHLGNLFLALQKLEGASKQQIIVFTEMLVRAIKLVMEEEMRSAKVDLHASALKYLRFVRNISQHNREEFRELWTALENAMISTFGKESMPSDLLEFCEKFVDASLLVRRFQHLSGVETTNAEDENAIRIVPIVKPFKIEPFVNTLKLQREGKLEQAEQLYLEDLNSKEERFGKNHPNIVPTLEHLASLYTAWRGGVRFQDAVEVLKRALDINRQHFQSGAGGEIEISNSALKLALLFKTIGNFEAAEPFFQESLDIRLRILGKEDIDVASSLAQFASVERLRYQKCMLLLVNRHLGKYKEAEDMFRQALNIQKNVLGNDSPEVAATMRNLGILLKQQGRFQEGTELYADCLAIQRKALGPDHPQLEATMASYSHLCKENGQFELARDLAEQVQQILTKQLGPDHPEVAMCINHLGDINRRQGNYLKAAELCEKALQLRKARLGDQHPDVASSMHTLAKIYTNLQRYSESENLLKTALELYKKRYGEIHKSIGLVISSLANLYVTQGRYEEGEPLCKQALELRTKFFGAESKDVAHTLMVYAKMYQGQGDLKKSEEIYRDCLRISKKFYEKGHPDLTKCIVRLQEVLERQGKPVDEDFYQKDEPQVQQNQEANPPAQPPSPKNEAKVENNAPEVDRGAIQAQDIIEANNEPSKDKKKGKKKRCMIS